MSAFIVTLLLLFVTVATYLWLIHRSWLRDAIKADHAPEVRTRIVILGGGFGGLYSALQFEKTIAADPSVEVTLVSGETSSCSHPCCMKWPRATWICPISSFRCARC